MKEGETQSFLDATAILNFCRWKIAICVFSLRILSLRMVDEAAVQERFIKVCRMFSNQRKLLIAAPTVTRNCKASRQRSSFSTYLLTYPARVNYCESTPLGAKKIDFWCRARTPPFLRKSLCSSLRLSREKISLIWPTRELVLFPIGS